MWAGVGRWELCQFPHVSVDVAMPVFVGHSLEKCCGPKYMMLLIITFVPCCSLALFLVHKFLADYFDAVFITLCFYGFGCKSLLSLSFPLSIPLRIFSKLLINFGNYLYWKEPINTTTALQHYSWILFQSNGTFKALYCVYCYSYKLCNESDKVVSVNRYRLAVHVWRLLVCQDEILWMDRVSC